MNGDILIKYEYCPDGFDASFIVQQVLAESDPEAGMPQHKFSFEKGRVVDEKLCFSDDLGIIWMVRRGRHDLHDMIKMATEDEKMLTKLLRVICWVLLVAGWMMIFSIISALLKTLPFGLNIWQLRSADQPPPDSSFVELSSFIHSDNVNGAVVSTY